MAHALIVGVSIERELRREKISRRLRARLDEGMVDEVRQLLASGIAPDDLIYYGLEYKFLTEYLIGRTKRQMTWFRGMERRGFRIHWLDATLPTEAKLEQIGEWMRQERRL